MPTRDTPFGAYNFLVEFDGNDPATSALGGFSDVSGIGTEVTLMEYRQGNDKENRVRKIPALHKAGDVTLKRGVIGAMNLWEWINAVRTGDIEAAKRNVVIKLLNEQRNATVVSWTLRRAMPIKWTGPTLTAKGGGDVAMEELTLSAEGVYFEAAS